MTAYIPHIFLMDFAEERLLSVDELRKEWLANCPVAAEDVESEEYWEAVIEWLKDTSAGDILLFSCGEVHVQRALNLEAEADRTLPPEVFDVVRDILEHEAKGYCSDEDMSYDYALRALEDGEYLSQHPEWTQDAVEEAYGWFQELNYSRDENGLPRTYSH